MKISYEHLLIEIYILENDMGEQGSGGNVLSKIIPILIIIFPHKLRNNVVYIFSIQGYISSAQACQEYSSCSLL